MGRLCETPLCCDVCQSPSPLCEDVSDDCKGGQRSVRGFTTPSLCERVWVRLTETVRLAVSH